MFIKVLRVIKRVFFIMIIVCLTFLIVKKNLPYEPYYFYKIGFKTYEPTEFWTPLNYFAYRDVIDNFGEPNRKDIGKNDWPTLYYDGMEITCFADHELAGVANIHLTSPEYRFGLYKIGIGSSKKLVDFAYKCSKAKPSPDGPNMYIDNHVFVEFIYDKNDNVSEIIMFAYNS